MKLFFIFDISPVSTYGRFVAWCWGSVWGGVWGISPPGVGQLGVLVVSPFGAPIWCPKMCDLNTYSIFGARFWGAVWRMLGRGLGRVSGRGFGARFWGAGWGAGRGTPDEGFARVRVRVCWKIFFKQFWWLILGRGRLPSHLM